MSQTAFKGEAITGPSLTLVSSSGKRMFPRVDQPLLITFDTGERFQARDWSVAGFSLPDGGFSSAKGAVHRVWLSIALSDCNIVVEADAKVSWVSGGSARGFRFIGLSSDKTRILDHFIESGIEGDTAVGYLPLQPRIAGLAHGRAKAGLLRAAHSCEAGLEAACVDGSGSGRRCLRRRTALHGHDRLCRGRGRPAAIACPGKRISPRRHDRNRGPLPRRSEDRPDRARRHAAAAVVDRNPDRRSPNQPRPAERGAGPGESRIRDLSSIGADRSRGGGVRPQDAGIAGRGRKQSLPALRVASAERHRGRAADG